jgi:hypothetical protein
LPAVLNEATITASHAVPAVVPSAAQGVPAPASRDALFAVLGREPLTGGPAGDLATGAAWTSTGTTGGPNTPDLSNAVSVASGRAVSSDPSPVGLLEMVSVDDGSRASAAATDSLFAGMAGDALPDE